MAAINAAGPDVFDNVITSVREDRRALLDAIAGRGPLGAPSTSAKPSSRQPRGRRRSTLRSHRRLSTATATPARSPRFRSASAPYDEGTSARDAATPTGSKPVRLERASANDAYSTKYANSIPLIQQQFKSDLATNFATTRANAQRDIATSKMSTDTQLAQLNLQSAQQQQAARQRAEDQAREDAIRLQEWARQDKQQALDNAYRQQKFDEDVREFGLQYTLSQARAAAAARAAARPTRPTSGSGSATRARRCRSCSRGSAGCRASHREGWPAGWLHRLGERGREHAPHAVRLGPGRPAAGLPTGTVWNAVGGAKAFAVPPIPPTRAPPRCRPSGSPGTGVTSGWGGGKQTSQAQTSVARPGA